MAGGKKVERIAEPRQHRYRRKNLYASCGQLNGKWQTVEPGADFSDGARTVLV